MDFACDIFFPFFFVFDFFLWIFCILIPFSISHLFQRKIVNELERREGLVNRGTAVFDECESVLFDIYGVDREDLSNLWPKNPFLKRARFEAVVDLDEGSSTKMPKLIEAAEVELVNVVCAVGNDGGGVGVAGYVADVPESEALLLEMRRLKIENLKKTSMLLDFQIQLAAFEMAAKRREFGSD